MPRDERMECNHCCGEGERRKLVTCGHPNDPDAAAFHEWVPCTTCDGTGEILCSEYDPAERELEAYYDRADRSETYDRVERACRAAGRW